MNCDCGAETIGALTPGGRLVDLDVGHVWVRPGEHWPPVFRLGVAGGGGGPAVPHATPVLEFEAPLRPAGPFRKEHQCSSS
jgi:hypothetical protein